MTKPLLLCIICTSLFFQAYSQPEKLHAHTDREVYYEGEAIWFSIYIKSDNEISTSSTKLYIDLLDETGKILQKKTAPIMYGLAIGNFDISDTAISSNLVLRAYTEYSLVNDIENIYYKHISISNENKEKLTTKELPTVSLKLFAEGGNFIPNMSNQIAFKATLNNGRPYPIIAAIKNDKGELIDSVSATHNGMGKFIITPNADESYAAIWIDNAGKTITTPLPPYTYNSIVLRVQQNEKKLLYQIQNPASENERKGLTVKAIQNNRLIFSTDLLFKKSTAFVGEIPTDSFSTGITQITVFNSYNQPLAERLVFINNEDYKLNTALIITASDLKKRKKIELELETNDTSSISHYSVSVFDADINSSYNPKNIYSELLLTSELKGYVYEPNWYFNNIGKQQKDALDLVMQTHGWRRFNYKNSKPIPTNRYITVQGKLTDNNGIAVANEMVIMIVQTKDSIKRFYSEITDANGYFTKTNLIFYDDATVYFKHNDSKNKNRKIQFVTYPDVVINGLDNISTHDNVIAIPATQIKYGEIIKRYNPSFKTKERTLKEVIVKAKPKTKNEQIQQLEKDYATGGFFIGGANSFQLDVLNDSTINNHLDFLHYLSMNIPGGFVKFDSKEYMANVLAIFHKAGIIVPILYINDSEYPPDAINTIRAEDVAYVKLFSNVLVMRINQPVLAIFLKRGKDIDKNQKPIGSKLGTIITKGYSPTKEFYSPDYSLSDSDKSIDVRNTLYWNPNVYLNKFNSKQKIIFYNNDISNRLKIIIEGMNEYGKLVHIEKLIE